MDFKKIRAENLKDFGGKISEWGDVLLTKLYSDKTHFIYELLQNAEDAKATDVIFNLYEDRLEIEHNGNLFNDKDIYSICRIVDSSKKGDKTKIGKFGIGFKSVYAYTKTPFIHSGHMHFLIKDYVKPCKAKTIKYDNFETVFNIPFNKEDDEEFKLNSYNEIKDKLSNLDTYTLLFITSISKITYYNMITEDVVKYEKKEIAGDNKLKKCQIMHDINNQRIYSENWYIFSEKNDTDFSLNNSYIAFKYAYDEDDKEKIVEVESSPLFVYFPTKKETFYKFLIQGNFETTSSRDDILLNDWNINQFRKISKLVSTVIFKMKKIKLLNMQFLDVLIPKSYFNENSIFSIIFKSIIEILSSEKELIPTNLNNEFANIKNGVLAENKDLLSLLDSAQLSKLLNSNNCKWIDYVPPNSELWKFLKIRLKIRSLNNNDLINHINGDFLRIQSDEWISNFYFFLSKHKNLWEKKYDKDPQKIIYTKKILRTEAGGQVDLFVDNKKNIYYPPKDETSFSTVKKSLITNNDIDRFLRNFGLREPSMKDEIYKFILPLYKLQKRPDKDLNFRHVKKIINYVVDNLDNELIESIMEIEFILAYSYKSKNIAYKKPRELYMPLSFIENRAIEIFYRECDVFLPLNNYQLLFDDKKLKSFYQLIKLSTVPKIETIKHSTYLSDEEKSNLKNSNNVINHGYQEYDYMFPWLNKFFEQITIEKSLFIWSLLIDFKNNYNINIFECKFIYIEKKVEYFIETESKIIRELRKIRWLPDSNVRFFRPEEIKFSFLHKNIVKDSFEAEYLANRLGFFEDELLNLLNKFAPDGKKCNLKKIHLMKKFFNLSDEEKIMKIQSILSEEDIEKSDFNHFKQYGTSENITGDKLSDINKNLNLLNVRKGFNSSEYNIESISTMDFTDLNRNYNIQNSESYLEEKKKKLNSNEDKNITEADKVEIAKWGEEFVMFCLENFYKKKYPKNQFACDFDDASFQIRENRNILVIVKWLNNKNLKDGVGRDIDIIEYDFNQKKNIKSCIEVKSTLSNSKDTFEITGAQLSLAQQMREHYSIHRVYGAGNTKDCRIIVIKNPFEIFLYGGISVDRIIVTI
jgi:hypothetical protein